LWTASCANTSAGATIAIAMPIDRRQPTPSLGSTVPDSVAAMAIIARCR
jgi:hypothetical protein